MAPGSDVVSSSVCKVKWIPSSELAVPKFPLQQPFMYALNHTTTFIAQATRRWWRAFRKKHVSMERRPQLHRARTQQQLPNGGGERTIMRTTVTAHPHELPSWCSFQQLSE
jgi:hypothetical protein